MIFHTAAWKIISTEIGGIRVMNVHPHSIELRWRTAGNITQEVEKYIGFHIDCEVVGNPTTNYRCLDIPYNKTDGWVYGTVRGLEENTDYMLRVVSYRNTTNGTVFVTKFYELNVTVTTIKGKLVFIRILNNVTQFLLIQFAVSSDTHSQPG